MNPVFGIHVGNTRACLAIYKQDDSKFCVEVIANTAGERVTPAIVTVTDTENIVGTACKSLMISRWSTTVTYNKRMLNRNTLENTTNNERRVATVVRDNEVHYELPLDNETVYKTPTEIATCMYRSLYEIAKSAVHGEEHDISCVLMVPKHFSEEAQFRVRSAAESVGWDVLHIVSEPAAALLGYNMLSDKTPPPSQIVLVYRVGGRSCDCSVIELNHGMISILDTEHTEDVGGKVLISTLTKYLADEFYRKYKLDPKESHRSLMKLTVAAENCLHVLSTIESANCFTESLCEGVDFSHTMSRARFESLLFPYLTIFGRPIHTVLNRLNMTPSNVSTVLLCGGLMKIPRLKKYISDIFHESGAKVAPLPNGINYDEVLACGAACQAGYITMDKMRDNFLPGEIDIPILEFPLTVKVEGAECEGLQLEAGQPLPAHRTLKLTKPNGQVIVTITQPDTDQTILKGQLQCDITDDLNDLKLEVDSENGIKVGVADAPEVFSYHAVKLYSQAIII